MPPVRRMAAALRVAAHSAGRAGCLAGHGPKRLACSTRDAHGPRKAWRFPGRSVESARERAGEPADEICGAGRYKVYGVEEYAYRDTPASPRHVAGERGGYTGKAVKKRLDIK